jgi:hypothetical protein
VFEGGYKEGGDACARGVAGVTVGCQGIVTLPDTVHELSIATSLHAYIRIRIRVVTSKLSQCARSEV